MTSDHLRPKPNHYPWLPVNPPDDGVRTARWPLAASLVLLVAMLAVVAWIGYHRTAGTLTYALDDAYIHMALAKNLAVHGVFGATPFEFTSSSSSPLWTLLLALAFKVFGVHDFIPLAMDVVIAIAVIFVADKVLRVLRVGDVPRFLGLFWIAAATPMAPIVFGGMEHPLQILIDVALVAVATILLSREGPGLDSLEWSAVVLSALASAVRYEGLLLVGVIAGLFVLRRRWAVAGAVIAASAAPVIAFGLFSMSNGGYFLPNSVLVKASTSSGVGLLLRNPTAYWAMLVARFPTARPIYPLVIASALLLLVQRVTDGTVWRPRTLFPLIAVLVSAGHLAFGDVGWFFRYEDYMVALLGMGLLAQLVWLAERRTGRNAAVRTMTAVAVLTATVGVAMCANRGNVAFRSTPWALKNIHDQQYQLARFLKSNPQYESVAIGDLGAIAYYNGSLHILDLEGLAETGEPLERLGREALDSDEIRQLAANDGAQIAIIFPDYFDQPKEWVEVGSLTIQNDLVTYDDTVIFLAIPPTDPSQLADDLDEFARASAPPDVTIRVVPENAR